MICRCSRLSTLRAYRMCLLKHTSAYRTCPPPSDGGGPSLDRGDTPATALDQVLSSSCANGHPVNLVHCAAIAGNPAALINVLMIVAAFSGKGSSAYVDAVRANLAAAGDNASRVLYIGATLAAEVRRPAVVHHVWTLQRMHPIWHMRAGISCCDAAPGKRFWGLENIPERHHRMLCGLVIRASVVCAPLAFARHLNANHSNKKNSVLLMHTGGHSGRCSNKKNSVLLMHTGGHSGRCASGVEAADISV